MNSDSLIVVNAANKLISQNTFPTTVIQTVVAGLILTFLVWFIKKHFKIFMNWHYDKLVNDSLFTTIVRLEYTARTVRLINLHKTLIARDMLEINFKCWARKVDKGQIKKKDIETTIYEVIGGVMDKYEAKWVEIGIPLIYINAIKDYHEVNISHIFITIQREFEEHYEHKSAKELARSILSILHAVYNITSRDFEIVINVLNGRTKDMVYKGVKNNNKYIKYKPVHRRLGMNGSFSIDDLKEVNF